MSGAAADTPSALLEIVRREFRKLYPSGDGEEIRLLKVSENLTFTVFSTCRKAVLRVSRPSYHTREELLAELKWMQIIRESGAAVIPDVFAGRDGEPIQSFCSPGSGTRYFCVLFSFLPGKTVRQLHGRELLKKTFQIGSVAASFHLLTQERPDTNRLPRFSWDLESLIGEHARWGPWQAYPGLSREDVRLFRNACRVIRERLNVYGKDPSRYGLIHSDLHLSNAIADGEKLQIIDFDDCGFGWFLYDLGCSLVEFSDHLGDLLGAWLDGYRTKRPLGKEDLAEVPTFLLLRRIVRLAWLASHSGSDTARSVGTEYLDVTRKLALAYVGEW